MYYGLLMETVADICAAVGRSELKDRLGVSRAAIANAVSDGRFPPRWYRVVMDLCAEKGVECPDELFNFLQPQTGAA